MATATTLPIAAGQAFDNLQLWWIIGALKTRIAFFCSTVNALFPQSVEATHPISNWVAVLFAIEEQMPVGIATITELTDAAEALYRMCWMTFTLINNGITPAQGAAVLAAYNGSF